MEISRIGFSGAIDRLPEVQGILSGIAVPSGVDAAQVAALKSDIGGSLDALAVELGNEAGPSVAIVDSQIADARAHVEDLGQTLGVIDANGGIVGEGATVEQFCDVSDYLSDIEVAWRNQRPTLLELQTALPHRRLRYALGALAAVLAVVMVLWLLLHNQKPQALAASEAPIFPNVPLSSVPPPSKVTAPTLDTNLHYTPRPNTTPPLTLNLPQETRTRTKGGLSTLDINALLMTSTPTAAPTGPLVVTPQTVKQSCNENNTYLSPLLFQIINHTGNPVLWSATVTGNWATALPAAGQANDNTTTPIAVTPTFDANGKAVACEQLANTGRRSGDFYLTITVNNFPYQITDTISLF